MLNAYLTSAFIIGVLFSIQAPINTVAAKEFGAPFPATVLSIGITLIISIILMYLTKTVPSINSIFSLPWWIIFGGLIGVLAVTGGIIIIPITGVALFFVCVVAGQLTGSVFLDHVGAFDLSVKKISFTKLFGICLAFSGVLLVSLSE